LPFGSFIRFSQGASKPGLGFSLPDAIS